MVKELQMNNLILMNDLDLIRVKLKREEFEVPSMISVIWPALFLSAAIMMLQFLLAQSFMLLDQDQLRHDAYFSLVITFSLCFSLSGLILYYRTPYLSLPLSIRKESNLLRFFIRKAISYSGVWLILNLLVMPVIVYFNGISPLIASISQICSFCILAFLLRIDLSRYKLAALKIIVDDWRKDKSHPLILN